MFKFEDHKQALWTWKNRGRRPDDPDKVMSMLAFLDAISTPDSINYLPYIVQSTAREVVEPTAVVSQLMVQLNWQGSMVMNIPTIGPTGTAQDIPEGGEYPEFSLHTGPGTQITTIGKSGVAFKFTEEMKRYSQWDIVNLHLRAAIRDLVRLKEQKCLSMLLSSGVTAFDNVNYNASSTIIGPTTGRSSDGAGNGSVTMDDIFDAYGIGLENGFVMDTIILHPLTWILWVKDPILRAFALQSGGGVFFAGWNGSPVNGGDTIFGGLGSPAVTPRTTNTSPVDPNVPGTFGPMMPSYLGIPFRIVVTPFMPYNPVTRLTHIIMMASGNAGALITDEGITIDEVPDKLRDMTKIKLRERYAVAPLNEGYGVVNIKNVKAVSNELAINPLVTPTSSVTFEQINRTTNVLD